jgi:hypothetical protein
MDANNSTDKIEAEPTAVLNNTQKYDVEVKTSHESEVESESQAIYLSIFGTAGNLLDLLVDRESSLTNNRSLFLAGKVDKFALFTKNVGKVSFIYFYEASSFL